MAFPLSAFRTIGQVTVALRPTWATETFSSIHRAHMSLVTVTSRGSAFRRAGGLRIASFTLPTSTGSNALDSIVKDPGIWKSQERCKRISPQNLCNPTTDVVCPSGFLSCLSLPLRGGGFRRESLQL